MELFAVKYGDSLFDSNRVFHQGDLRKKEHFHWLLYLIRYNEKVIFVDTGFADNPKREQYQIDYTDPFEILGRLGITAEDATDVIITHAHFDHIENLHRFKNANVYIQKEERTAYIQHPYDEKVKKRLQNDEKIITFTNSYTLYNTFTVQKIGGHSSGSSVVYFTHNGTKYILTGDECYLKRNYLENIPIGNLYNYEKNAAFIQDLANSYDEILTFHDPAVVGDSLDLKQILP